MSFSPQFSLSYLKVLFFLYRLVCRQKKKDTPGIRKVISRICFLLCFPCFLSSPKVLPSSSSSIPAEPKNQRNNTLSRSCTYATQQHSKKGGTRSAKFYTLLLHGTNEPEMNECPKRLEKKENELLFTSFTYLRTLFSSLSLSRAISFISLYSIAATRTF